jgi:hypothetical protein
MRPYTAHTRLYNTQNGALRAPRPAHHNIADPSAEMVSQKRTDGLKTNRQILLDLISLLILLYSTVY